MKNFLFTILVFFALLGSQSCGKDTDEFIPTNTNTVVINKGDTVWQTDLLVIGNLPTSQVPSLAIEKLMSELASNPTNNEVNAERGGIITTPDNVTVEFQPNSCVTQNNRPCTGALKVEVLVLRKKGEFLLNNVPTVSGGKQLISGGAVRVKVTQNGEEVFVSRTTPYKVRFQPTTALDNTMKLFEGKELGRFNFDWVAVPTNLPNSPRLTPLIDSSQGTRKSVYELGLDRFSWINCDRFSGDSTSLTNKFCVALPDTFTNQNTTVYVVFKDINSVVSLLGNGPTKQFCVPSYYRGLPIGKIVNLISISTYKDRIYVGKKEVTIAANSVIPIVPTSMSKEAAKELISNL
jgi:hypothetical protein